MREGTWWRKAEVAELDRRTREDGVVISRPARYRLICARCRSGTLVPAGDFAGRVRLPDACPECGNTCSVLVVRRRPL